MSSIAWLALLGLAMTGGSSISGRVLGPDGNPVSQAQVILEYRGTLVRSSSTPDGTFRFENVEPGLAGVFAVAEGLALGGASVNIAIADVVPGLVIRLAAPDSVSGKVSDFKGNPVAGAVITRVAILGETKVGIPLSGLEPEGIRAPISKEDGRFTVPRLPKGAVVALKISHPAFAQEGVSDISVGSQNVRVTLYPGVLVQGNVLSRDRSAAVMNASVIIRNAQPPHDSTTVNTNVNGAFSLRLKPGVYLYQAQSTQFRSPGWEQLTITGDQPEQRVTLRATGMSAIQGKVLNALTGDPVNGARLKLVVNGNTAAVVRTGPTGEYALTAAEGENFVTLESTPGFQPPTNPALRVNAVEGQTIALPDFWLAPIPAYNVTIIDAEGRPAPGVVIRILRPVQFGWHVTDAEGSASLQFLNFPPGGTVLGIAEHPDQPLGALFALQKAGDTEAKVQLLPLSTVRGRVVTTKGRPLPGAIVGALFADDSPTAAEPQHWSREQDFFFRNSYVGSVDVSEKETNESLLLWRTLSREDGSFDWEGAMPFLPQRCLAYAGPNASGESKPFNLKPESAEDLGNVVVEGGVNAPSMCGKPLKWYENRLLGGTLPERAIRKNTAAVVLYCTPEEAPAVIEALTNAKKIARLEDVVFAAVIKGEYACGEVSIPVLSGAAPAAATTYLIGPDGKVVLETFDLPPVRALRRLSRPAKPL